MEKFQTYLLDKIHLVTMISIFLIFCSVSMAQTAEQRTAKAYCQCAETTENFDTHLELLKSGSNAAIDSSFNAIKLTFYSLKGCVAGKVNATFTKEEAQSLNEENIYEELENLCPDLSFFLNEHRKLSEAYYNE